MQALARLVNALKRVKSLRDFQTLSRLAGDHFCRTEPRRFDGLRALSEGRANWLHQNRDSSAGLLQPSNMSCQGFGSTEIAEHLTAAKIATMPTTERVGIIQQLLAAETVDKQSLGRYETPCMAGAFSSSLLRVCTTTLQHMMHRARCRAVNYCNSLHSSQTVKTCSTAQACLRWFAILWRAACSGLANSAELSAAAAARLGRDTAQAAPRIRKFLQRLLLDASFLGAPHRCAAVLAHIQSCRVAGCNVRVECLTPLHARAAEVCRPNLSARP